MKEELKKAIKHCAEKASKADDSNDALKYTQAAVNAANALHAVKEY